VFVPRSAPGDVVEAEVDWTRKPARARVLKLLHASPVRAVPPCPLADRCGGCDLMHISLEAQMLAHRDMVRGALAHAVAPDTPGDPDWPLVATHAAPRAEGYRTRARLAITAVRGRVSLGYRESSSHALVDIAHCTVLDARLDVALAELRKLFPAEQGRGEVSIALGARERPVLDVRWTGELGGSFFASLDERVATGILAGAEVWLEGARSPARFGQPEAVMTGADGEALVVPSGAFAQAHPVMNAKLGERLLARAGVAEQATLELFAGSGNFTVLLARHAGALTAVESEPRAVVAARSNLASRGLRAKVVEADADAFDVPSAIRTVVLDPPRAGAAGAIERIARSKARRVVYVSCNVSTLARDVATLGAAGFQLQEVEMFEMFPHTSHVEVLALLERGSRAKSTRTDS
jgi:23S rRNA (uracil1939-C5)-methyltransferase